MSATMEEVVNEVDGGVCVTDRYNRFSFFHFRSLALTHPLACAVSTSLRSLSLSLCVDARVEGETVVVDLSIRFNRVSNATQVVDEFHAHSLFFLFGLLLPACPTHSYTFIQVYTCEKGKDVYLYIYI